MRGGTLPSEATGIAQDIVRVLNENRSPLSFRLQPIVLHLDTFDGGDASWREDGASDLVLVARREEFVLTHQAPDKGARELQNEATHQTIGTTLASAAVAAVAIVGEERQEAPEKYPTEFVVAQEELGRSYPFKVRSKTALVSGSIKVPSEAFVTDVQKGARGRKGLANQRSTAAVGKGKHAATRADSGQQKMTRIVLELVQETTAARAGERGSAFSGMAPFNLVKSRLSSDGGAEKDNKAGSGDCRVVARAILDPSFLRRTIASQRSVLMTTVPGAVRQTENQIQEETEPTSFFARLDVAGHAVCARPGPPHIRLEVMECQNLKQADVLGKSDPCVLVFWNGGEIGRTPIARDDLNPVFLAPTGEFRLPLRPGRISPQKEPSTVTVSDEGRQRLGLQTLLAPWMKYAPEVRLEVWDMDRDILSRKWEKGELLGTVTMCGPSEIVPVLKSSPTKEVVRKRGGVTDQGSAGVLLRLAAEKSNRSRCDGSLKDAVAAPMARVSAGVILLKMTVEDPTDGTDVWIAQATAQTHDTTTREEKNETVGSGERGVKKLSSSDDIPCFSTIDASRGPTSSLFHGDAQEGAFLGVRCLDARGLPLGSDAYCRVFWNGRQVGKTPLASGMIAAHQTGDINHCDDSSATVVGGKRKSKDSPSPAVSASQRNPVWWKPRSPLTEANGGDLSKEESGRSNMTPVVVPLYEQSEGDELTLEVFDGRNRKGCVTDASAAAAAVKPGKQCSDGAGGSKNNIGDHSSCGSKTEQQLTDERLGSQSHGRDMVGKSLGSVTIRGETLIFPPQGRVHFLLSPSPTSSPSPNKTGGTLSISLERVSKYQEAVPNVTAEPKVTTPFGIIERNDTSTPSSTIKTTTEEENPPIEEPGHQPKRWLCLHLEGAQLKHGLDLSGTSDPFCAVYVNNVWHKETRVCWGTLAPRWDRWLEIEICRQEAIEGFLRCPEIRVEVWDKDAFSADDFIGEATLFLLENQHG